MFGEIEVERRRIDDEGGDLMVREGDVEEKMVK